MPAVSARRYTIKTVGFDKLSQKIDQAGEKTAHSLAVQIQKDTEPFVPVRTKSLANRLQVKDEENPVTLATLRITGLFPWTVVPKKIHPVRLCQDWAKSEKWNSVP